MNQAIKLNNENPVFKDMLSLMARLKDLRSVSELLSYDQETAMPALAVKDRSGMIGTVDSLYHSLLISKDAERIADGLVNIMTEFTPHEKRLAGLFIEEHEKALKIPEDFINLMSRVQSHAVDCWNTAKQNSSYPLFMDSLSDIVDIKRRHAEYLGKNSNPYNALIKIHNPDYSFDEIAQIFTEIETKTKKILKQIDFHRQEYQVKELFSIPFSYQEKKKISENIASRLGFDFAGIEQFDRLGGVVPLNIIPVMIGPHQGKPDAVIVAGFEKTFIQCPFEIRAVVIIIPVENKGIHAIVGGGVNLFGHHIRVGFILIPPGRHPGLLVASKSRLGFAN